MNFRGLDRWILLASIAYGVLLAIVWSILQFGSDVVWWGTVLLFLPRWIWLVPLVPLAIAFLLRRRQVWIAAFGLLTIGAMIVWGVNIPWRGWLADSSGSEPICILTCNCDNRALDVMKLRELIEAVGPDVVSLQDIRDRDFAMVFAGEKWHLEHVSELAIASRLPIITSEPCSAPELASISGAIRHYELDRGGQKIHFFNVHLATPRWGLRAIYRNLWNGASLLQVSSNARRRQSEVASRYAAKYENVLVAGDFNTPPESSAMWHNWVEFQDAFTIAGWGLGNTFDTGWGGLRIDYVKGDHRWQCRECWIADTVGSAHRPLIAIWQPVAGGE
jgi:vancomycin resistance protein VanJ